MGPGRELATPGSAVRLASVARHITDCATWSGQQTTLLLDRDQDQHSFFKEYHQSVKQFGSRSGPSHSAGSDLSPNCLQRSSTDEKS